MKQRFSKYERLKSLKLIEDLFARGQTIKGYPLIAVIHPVEMEEGVKLKAGFSVSKKRFKRAVDRNTVKRRMREAFRLNKAGVTEHLRTSYAVMFIYISGELISFERIEKGMKEILARLDNKKE